MENNFIISRPKKKKDLTLSSGQWTIKSAHITANDNPQATVIILPKNLNISFGIQILRLESRFLVHQPFVSHMFIFCTPLSWLTNLDQTPYLYNSIISLMLVFDMRNEDPMWRKQNYVYSNTIYHIYQMYIMSSTY